MKIHIFQGQSDTFGLTPDETGANLPPQHGPWKQFKVVEMKAGGRPLIGASPDEVLAAVEKEGFFLSNVSVESEIRTK